MLGLRGWASSPGPTVKGRGALQPSSGEGRAPAGPDPAVSALPGHVWRVPGVFILFRLGLPVHPVCLQGSEAPSKSEGAVVSYEEVPIKGSLVLCGRGVIRAGKSAKILGVHEEKRLGSPIMMHLIHLAATAGLGWGRRCWPRSKIHPSPCHVGARGWDLGDGVVQREGLVHREAW